MISEDLMPRGRLPDLYLISALLSAIYLPSQETAFEFHALGTTGNVRTIWPVLTSQTRIASRPYVRLRLQTDN